MKVVYHAYHVMSGRFEKVKGVEIKIYRKNLLLDKFLVNFELQFISFYFVILLNAGHNTKEAHISLHTKLLI